jgi:hypothetical protein
MAGYALCFQDQSDPQISQITQTRELEGVNLVSFRPQ